MEAVGTYCSSLGSGALSRAGNCALSAGSRGMVLGIVSRAYLWGSQLVHT